MVLGYLTILVLTVLGNSLLSSSLTSSRLAQRAQLQEEVFYLAEGGLEDAAARFAQAMVSFEVPTTAPRYPVDEGPVDNAEMLTTAFSSDALPGAFATSVITEVQDPAEYSLTDPDGITIFIKRYRIRTTVTHPDYPTITQTLNQVVTRRVLYAFQHAIFYNGDLEWLPGKPMAVAGRVHTNSDLYLGTCASCELKVDSEYLRAAGHIYNRQKTDGNVPPGPVKIRKAGTSDFEEMDGLDSDDADWPSESQTRWNGTVKTSVHGVKKLGVPSVGSIAPDGFFASQAGLIITDDPTEGGPGTLMRNGIALQEGVHIPEGTVETMETGSSFFNNREGKFVRMTEIDLRKLAGFDNCDADPEEEQCFPNQLPENGLIYATRTDAISTEQPGIRLRNGSQIHSQVSVQNPSGGLTIVSNDPVYIQGDFNAVNQQPVAIIADAINVLSNAWSDDANSTKALDSFRVAGPTTVNAAMISGIVPTVGGDYSGGVENFPRLHERWTGKELWISGSFVSLWDSQIATGKWHNGAPYYRAPLRLWSYDQSFGDGSSLPPFTPMVVEMANEAWWEE